MHFQGGDGTAREALRTGLVSRLEPPDRLVEGSEALAAELIERPVYAPAATKRLVRERMDLLLAAALDLERRTHATMETPEQRGAAQAQAMARRKTYAKAFRPVAATAETT